MILRTCLPAVGYTPYKALNNAIDLGNGVTDSAYNYAVTMQPKRIFIMLGSNGITAAASMEESYRTLVEKLQANCRTAPFTSCLLLR